MYFTSLQDIYLIFLVLKISGFKTRHIFAVCYVVALNPDRMCLFQNYYKGIVNLSVTAISLRLCKA